MKRTSLAILFTALPLVTLSSLSQATVITPVGVTASSTFHTYNKDNLINDSGLAGGLHDTSYWNMWLNNGTGANGTLTFDLGAVYALTSSSIWQYNATCCGLNRGVNGFDIFSSTDGLNFNLVTSANLTQSPGGNIPAQNIAFSTTASHIRFDITSNHGDSSYTGLSEVKFYGTPSSVPEPFSLALMLFGMSVGGYRAMRRQRRLM